MIEEVRVDSVNMQVTEYVVFVRLKEEYHAEYAQLTDENVGNFLALIYKGKIINPSLPTIQTKITGGHFSIGPYKKEEKAKEVMKQILNENEVDSF